MFSRTNHGTAALVTQFVWKEMFLNIFDPPPPTLDGSHYPWSNTLARRYNAELVAQLDPCPDGSARALAIETFITVIREAIPQNPGGVEALSRDLLFVKEALHDSHLLNIVPSDPTEANLLSHLRCLTGFEEFDENRSSSRAFVYSLVNYSEEYQYGPRNWTHAERLVCLGFNLQLRLS